MKIRLHITVDSMPPYVFEHSAVRVAIGRDPACELTFKNSTGQAVSWQHAQVELTPQGAYLTDLESTNGTFVNDERVTRRTELKVGDELRLGMTEPRMKVLSLDLAVPAPKVAPPEDTPAPKILPPDPSPVGPPRGQTVLRQEIYTLRSKQKKLLTVVGVLLGCFVVGGLAAFWNARRNRPAEDRVAAKQVSPSTLVGAGIGDDSARGRKQDKQPPATNAEVPPLNDGPPIERKLPPDLPKDDVAAVPVPNGSDDTRTPKPPEKVVPSPEQPLAQQAVAILKEHCEKCHGPKKRERGLDVTDRDNLLTERKKGKKPYFILLPGKPEESRLLEKISDESMPPDGPPVPEKDRELLKEWIVKGAPAPTAEPVIAKRSFKSDLDVLQAINKHLVDTLPQRRREQRYFTLTHLQNNPKVSERQLRLHRAALSKLVNSLTQNREIIPPRALDPDGTIFNIDLRELGWTERNLWQEILNSYPYGVRFDQRGDEAKRNLAAEVYQLAGTALPMVRADWFVAFVSRPPLYHTMLALPTTGAELERAQGVNVVNNFNSGNLARAAFVQSGVSRQNRLVERHDSRDGAYWKSYDFLKNEGRGDLLKFPLGPQFPGNPFPDRAFKHDGGEIVFNLPNGLQAYMLLNAQDQRIDEGPINVVNDRDEISGTPSIVNGLSCMACHRHGMREFKDEIRTSDVVIGPARAKVEQLFKPQAQLDELLKRDADHFLAALDKAVGPFLKVGEDAGKKLTEFEEPIAVVAKPHTVFDISLEDAALELGLRREESARLKTVIEGNDVLREKFALAPLAQGGVIKRQAWESLTEGLSPCQRAARALNIGEPIQVVAPAPAANKPAPAADPKKRVPPKNPYLPR